MQEWSPPSAFSEYRVLHAIGRGQMGRVFLAHDTLLDRQVAVKFVSALAPSEAARDRFLTEARAAARLQHPNVVTVHRVGEIDGRPFLVSEFVRGLTLDQMPKPVPWDRALAIGIGLARGLAAAHRKGVLHRDIKPANAILADDGSPKLLDFGLAKFDVPVRDAKSRAAPRAVATLDPAATIPPDETGDLARASLDGAGGDAAVGTPDYMAPEIWRGEPGTRRSDVYAFGALLYELCAGVPPHGRLSIEELSDAVQTRVAPPLSAAVPSVDARLDALVERCLRRDPDERFASGDELREALEALERATAGADAPTGNPYRGLHTFEAEHRALFFGRGEEVGVVLDRLRNESFVLLGGDSGVGKSSICRAGVLPLLQGGALGCGRAWSTFTLTCGRHPVAALASLLAPHLAAGVDAVAMDLRRNPEVVVVALRRRLGDGQGLVCFIDQLEELVTQSERAEAMMTDEILARLAEGIPGVRVLATARADYLTRLATLPRLGEAIARALFLVRPLAPERLRDVIEGPAHATNVRFESSALVDELVHSAAQAEAGLPLLQFTLAQLWEARDVGQGIITKAALAAMGGVAGALARHADAVIASLRPAQRTQAKRILLRLVQIDGTRVRRREEELTGGEAVAHTALDALVRARLVVAHEIEDGTGFEVAHEALTQGWDTLRTWLHEDADRRVVLDRLARGASEWQRLARSKEALWGERQLAEAASISLEELNPAEAAFLERSRRAVRGARRLRWGLLLGVPLLLAGSLGGLELRSRREIERRVDQFVREAERAIARARVAGKAEDAATDRATVLFAAGKRDEGQREWAVAQKSLTEADAAYSDAGRSLESALTWSAQRDDVRDLHGDVLFERVLLAERAFSARQRTELRLRLGVYDRDGSRERRLDAPIALRVDTVPAGANVRLERFDDSSQTIDRWAPVRAPSATPLAVTELVQGSYRLTLTAPGRATVRFPFVARRGKNEHLTITLPGANEVPAGFVFVPEGAFQLGSAAEESLRRGFFDTVPLHASRTGAFLIATHEVTVEDWMTYLAALPPAERAQRRPHVEKAGFTGAVDLREEGDGKWRYRLALGKVRQEARAGEPLRFVRRDRRAQQDWRRFPVTGISALDAQAYAQWLHKSGRLPGARLCSELEWERAARGADGRSYPHGSHLAPDDANHDATYARDPEGMGPDEVGSHPASRSPFGVEDMTGNAFEWTTSAFAAGQFVARGGSYFYDLKTNEIPNRQVSVATLRDATLGLRLCATPRGARRP
jgi:formylglycine-generating enzyme required for sulfatase activity